MSVPLDIARKVAQLENDIETKNIGNLDAQEKSTLDAQEKSAVDTQEKSAITITLKNDDKKMGPISGIYETLQLVRELDIRESPSGRGEYSLILASFLKSKGEPLTEKDEISARRLARILPIFCVGIFLKEYDIEIYHMFTKSISNSKLSGVEKAMINNSATNQLSLFSDVLAENNNGRMIEEELLIICKKYNKPDCITEKQKSFILRHLEKELLDF